MKKLLIIPILLLININVLADTCTYNEQKELNAYYKNIDMGYSVVDEYSSGCTEDGMSCSDHIYSGFHFLIYINNLNERVYAEVTNSLDYKTTIYYYDQSNGGNISITQDYSDSKVEYFIKILPTSGNCMGTTLKQKTVTTPRFNVYSSYPICSNAKNFGLCKRFSDTEVTEDQFYQKINKYYEEKNEKEDNTKTIEKENIILNFIRDNYIYLSIAGGVIIILVITSIIIKRRKRLV